MLRRMDTAVVAAAAQHTRTEALHALAEAGIELLSMERSPADVCAALENFSPDLLIADENFPQLEGALLAERILHSRSLPVRPAVILLHDPAFACPYRKKLEDMGVCILEKPLRSDALRSAADRLAQTPPYFSESEVRSIDCLLDEMGIAPSEGRSCLKAAVLLCTADQRFQRDKRSRLYRSAAALCDITEDRAQRAMHRALESAWQDRKFETNSESLLCRLPAGTRDSLNPPADLEPYHQGRIPFDAAEADRDLPSCREMISRLADILRLEG